jgi:hypothetical protein
VSPKANTSAPSLAPPGTSRKVSASMTERQNEGAGHGAEERGAMEWRLESLHRRTEEGVRELGARVLDMYHQGKVDPDAVREAR